MSEPRCRRLGPKTLEVRSSPGWVATLFGLPFLGGGLWLASQDLYAIYLYFTKIAWRDFLGFLLGVTVLTLFALCFLVPGVLLVSFRKRVVIDGEAGTVVDTKDFYVWRLSKRYSLDAFNRIRLQFKDLDANSEDSYSAYNLELCGLQEVLLGLWKDRSAAEAVARDVSEVTGISFGKKPRSKA